MLVPPSINHIETLTAYVSTFNKHYIISSLFTTYTVDMKIDTEMSIGIEITRESHGNETRIK